jgi:hypothetical protein
MDNATISAYKQEFFTYALAYNELVNVPFCETPVAGQKIFGIKLETTESLGRIDANGHYQVREDLIELLAENGYKSDSLVIDIGFGYDEACTCDKTDCHNMYSSFSCRESDASKYLRDLVKTIIDNGASQQLLAATVDEWLLVPLLTTKHIDAKTVFIVIPTAADESHYSSIITI